MTPEHWGGAITDAMVAGPRDADYCAAPVEIVDNRGRRRRGLCGKLRPCPDHEPKLPK